MSQIRIVSDGTPQNTSVYTADGHEIRGVTEVDVHVSHQDHATAVIQFINVEFEMLADWNSGQLKAWAQRKIGK